MIADDNWGNQGLIKIGGPNSSLNWKTKIGGPQSDLSKGELKIRGPKSDLRQGQLKIGGPKLDLELENKSPI